MCYKIITGLIDFVIPFPKVFIRVVPSLFQLINPQKVRFHNFSSVRTGKSCIEYLFQKIFNVLIFLGILILVFPTILPGRTFAPCPSGNARESFSTYRGIIFLHFDDRWDLGHVFFFILFLAYIYKIYTAHGRQ